MLMPDPVIFFAVLSIAEVSNNPVIQPPVRSTKATDWSIVRWIFRI